MERVTGQLIPAQRRQRLLEALRGSHVLSIRELVDALGVSHMTVRRDIAALEEDGMVRSVSGGVRLAGVLQHEPVRTDKATRELPQKQAMARTASALVEDGMVLYVDAGTTLLPLVPFLVDRSELTVVTNDFVLLQALAALPSVEAIHVGGRLEPANMSSVGPLAAATVADLAIDLALLSASSWDLAHGVTTPSEAKVAVKRAALEASGSRVLVAGSSKFDTSAKYRVAPLRAFDRVVTDAGMEQEAVLRLEADGVVVDRAQPDPEDAVEELG